jgi:hypothetical protein
MMFMRETTPTRKPSLAIAAVILVFLLAGCASGPLGSHGVDYSPAFDVPYSGGGRG